ncbi:MAG: M20 family metallopeptidase [Oligoflexia bacterium]|nr:M20 family metallopeptidase [Oligoflexia bacterium]
MKILNFEERYLKKYHYQDLLERPWHESLVELVKINSQTKNVAGVNNIQDRVEYELKNLGLLVSRFENELEDSGDLVVGELPSSNGQGDFITLICHADTVFEPYEIIEINNEIIGSGVIDNKGGLLLGLHAIKSFVETIKHNNVDLNIGLRFICSPNEETGSNGFHHIFKDLSKSTILACGLEPALENGDVVLSRKGNRWYNVFYEGVKGHAGRSHHKSANACSELALSLSKLLEITNYEKGTTLNIGKISGGISHNVVSDKASAQLDLRFNDIQSREEAHRYLNHCFVNPEVESPCNSFKTRIDFEVVDDCPPMSLTDKSIELFEKYKSIYSQISSMNINYQKVGGAADINYFGEFTEVLIDGLGPIGRGMHTHSEAICKKGFIEKKEALKELLLCLNKEISFEKSDH